MGICQKWITVLRFGKCFSCYQVSEFDCTDYFIEAISDVMVSKKVLMRQSYKGTCQKAICFCKTLNNWTGSNTDYSMNFIPVMDQEMLQNGYQKIVRDIYSCKLYYTRVYSFLKQFNPPFRNLHVNMAGIIAFVKTIFLLGIFKEDRKYYWHLLLWSFRKKPKAFLW